MAEHWSLIELLAKERQAEYLRQAREIALAERAAKASGDSGSLIWRLLAASVRRLSLARANKPALSKEAPRSW
jgi:hypothetical protein